MDTDPTPPPSGLLARLAAFSVRRRRFVVLAWLVLLLGAAAANRTVGGEFHNDLSLPDTDSQAAFDDLRERFPERAGDPLQVVIRDEGGLDAAATRTAVTAVAEDIAAIDGVVGVRTPYEGPAPAISADGTTALLTVQFADRTRNIPDASIAAVQELATPLIDAGLQVEFGGPPMEKEHGPSGSEAIGLVAAMGILLLAFGSVVAMLVPIGVAVAALALGIQIVGLLTGAVTIGTAGPVVAAMIGLGVGIDYALLIVTRHRENLAGGMTAERSIAVAMATAGRSVLVAGLTVIIAILSLYLIGIEFVAAIGLASATTVTTTLLASLTLLPALLGFAGRNIDRWSIRSRRYRAERDHTRGWQRWIALVQRHAWVSFGASLAVLVILAVPLLSMRLGSGDAGSNPTTDTTRRAYDLVSDAFGPGYNGPLLVTVSAPDGFAPAPAGGGQPAAPATATVPAAQAAISPDLRPIWAAVSETEGVARVAPPELNATGDTAVLAIIPEGSPQSEATEDLVHRLRGEVLPEVAAEGFEVHVGGPTAVAIDLADEMSERLPIFMAGILVLSFLLLTVEFRSLFVPLKAAIMNLLSIGAAYGAVVAVFQWGWLSDVFGQRPGPIESFAPMMLFAVLFGLSMDYEVFLLSRVREEYEATGDNSRAVSVGISATARVITAAASVMIIVFGSFLLNDQRVVNMFGFGLAVAILLDATIVRTVLVPATMELAGAANWWLPRWLARLLPDLHGGGVVLTAGGDGDAPPEALPERGALAER
jgi:putative drug exporter of the RND superfamily